MLPIAPAADGEAKLIAPRLRGSPPPIPPPLAAPPALPTAEESVGKGLKREGG